MSLNKPVTGSQADSHDAPTPQDAGILSPYIRWNASTLLRLSLAGGLAFGFACALLPAQVTPIPVTADPQQSDGPDSVRIAMRAKLAYSQKILEGLVTQDFEAIEQAADALSEMSLRRPPRFSRTGDRSDEQVYEHFRMEFTRLSGRLRDHARRQQPEAAAYAQQNLTATCIACHDYLRDHK